MADLFTPLHEESRHRRRQMLHTAFGAAIAKALTDKNVLEVMVNPDGKLWLDHAAQGRIETGQTIAAAEVERTIRMVATHVRRTLTDDRPIVSAELPETGERFEGVMPPISAAPCFSIRKPAHVVHKLDDYVRQSIMTPNEALGLRQAVNDCANIVIVGGTSSGKTTLANALLAEIAARRERIIILEDTRELHCAAADCVSLRTRPGYVSLAELVRTTLRLRPDRIIVGEVRGPEALDMLKAWNTGHPGGITTVHANSAETALTRIEQLVQEAVVKVPRNLIADAIDIIVFIAGRGRDRRLQSMLRLEGLDAQGRYCLTPCTTPKLQLIEESP